MNQFINESKAILKKLDQGKVEKGDVDQLIRLSNDKLSDFHLYSLGLKYYSYVERNVDIEDEDENLYSKLYHQDEHEHVHTDECNQGEEHVHTDECSHTDHSHEHDDKLTCESLDLIKTTFDDYVKHFAKTGELPNITELLEIRKDLQKHVLVLTAYGDQITLFENVYYKSRYDDEQMVALESDESFAKKVVDILMAYEDSSEIREHLKYIYPELPMRMTNNKFFSYVDEYFDKLKGIPTEDVKNHIQMLKETFDPRVVEGYGSIAPNISVELEKVQEILINGSKGDKDSAYHYLYHLTEDKNELLELGLDIAELLNHLLALALCRLDSENSKVYKVVLPLLKGESDEEELAQVFDDVEINYEPLGQALINVSSMIDRYSGDEKLISTFDRVFEINELKYALELTKDGYFIERPFAKDESVPSYSELTMIKNELVGLMDKILSEESRVFKRGRMSLMMGTLQIVHSNGQEIYDHIYQAISSCNVKGEKVMSMQNIYSYLNDFMD